MRIYSKLNKMKPSKFLTLLLIKFNRILQNLNLLMNTPRKSLSLKLQKQNNKKYQTLSHTSLKVLVPYFSKEKRDLKKRAKNRKKMS